MDGASRREWVGLGILALTAMLVSVDVFVLLLALPRLSADLGADGVQQLWMLDIYGFMVGGFLVTMGNIGDRIGRRRLLLIGAAAFGFASLAAAYASSPEMLIAARALLGIAGATLGPTTLGLIRTMFLQPRQLGLAVGIWSAFFTVGAILGPIIGGVLLERFWWGSVFLINVPVMALVLALGPALLPPDPRRAGLLPGAGRIDVASVALSLMAILPFAYGVKEVARQGWHPGPVLALVAGVLFGVVFVLRQRRLASPLLDLTLFRDPVFSTGLLALLAFSVLSGAVMMLATQYFQLVDGLSPLLAGLALLPGMVASTISVLVAPVLARRVRPAHLIAGGLLVVAVGMLVMTTAGATGGSGVLIAGFTVWCAGGGPLLCIGIGQVISAAPPDRAGAAASMPQISNELGAALGFAVIGSLAAAIYRAVLHVPAGTPANIADTARDSLAGAATGPLAGHAHAAYATALHVAAAVSAIVLIAVAALFWRRCRHLPPLSGGEREGRGAAVGQADGLAEQERQSPHQREVGVDDSPGPRSWSPHERRTSWSPSP
jgi:DHA2 family multidrug resistance protein-like MFS transporter